VNVLKGKAGSGGSKNGRGIWGRIVDFAEGFASFIIGLVRGAIGLLGRLISWIGSLVLLFGAYEYMGGGTLDLAWIGIGVTCLGELMVFLKGLSGKERDLLEEKIVGKLLTNMAFPLLWLAIYYFLQMDFLLAFAASSGVRAIIENARITASFYIAL
jgi:hypothetical protein